MFNKIRNDIVINNNPGTKRRISNLFSNSVGTLNSINVATSMAFRIRKAEEFARTVKKGVKGVDVPGYTPNVKRFRKNGKYIDLASDGSILSFGK